MIPLLLDQGLPVGAARKLRAKGWDVVHVSERGLSETPDVDLLVRAANESRVLVGPDSDFPMLVALRKDERPSVVHIRRQHVDFRACASLLEDLIPRVLDELELGAVVSVRDEDVRVRRLPVHG